MGDVIEILTTATNTVEVEAAGPQGTPGVGVPTGGSALQVLRKKTGTDYDTEWATGGGGASYDQELNTTDSVTFESVTADKVAFDLTAAETAAQGELAWNADEETLDLGLAHGSVLQVGQETLYHVENSTASTIPAGTLCVFSGTVGNSGKLRVAPHADNTNPTAIIGVATSTIAAGVGEEGYVTHFGKCRGINASGGAEAWANGDLLYASPTGGLTKTKPAAPIVTVAAVVSNSTSGTLFVRPSFGQTAADVGAAPTSHAASHAAAGSDPLAPSDIGAQSIFETANETWSSDFTLTAARAKQYNVQVTASSNVSLPISGHQVGDVVVVYRIPTGSGTLNIRRGNPFTTQWTVDFGVQLRWRATGTGASNWELVQVDSHDADRISSGTLKHERGGLEADVSAYNGLVKIASGSTSAVAVTSAGEALLDDADAAAQRTTLGLGTAATSATGDFAAASHSHGNINSSGQVGSTANLPLKTGTGGIVEAGVFGTGAGEFSEGNHTHADLHTRSHAITSTSDHTAGNHKVFYSNGSGEIVELALGSSGEVLTSNGATSAPSFAAAAGGGFGEVRFDTATVYTYTGQAAAGASESASVWFIRRSEYSSAGAYVSTTTANNVEWDDRLTASYT